MSDNDTVDYGLHPIWDALLEIYKAFSVVCDRHGLRYYAFAGTALGAVRHNGFIPWDDDMDLAMPRPDYEQFIRIADKELPAHLKFVNWRNTPELNIVAGKIQDSRRQVVAQIEKSCRTVLANGIFIDIYPIDGYPTGMHKLWTKIRLRFLDLIKYHQICHLGRQDFKSRVKWILGAILSFILPCYNTKTKLFEKYEKMLLEANYEKSSCVGDIGYSTSIFLHPSLPKEIWGTPILHRFENINIPLPSDVSAHLANNYGDYMTLPPEEMRHPSHDGSLSHYPWWLGPTAVEEL